MIIPKIGRGQIGMTAPTPMQGQEEQDPRLAAQQALAQPGQGSGIQVAGTTPSSSLVPQMPMNVQHPVAKLPEVEGVPQVGGGGANDMQQGLGGLKQIMGAAQKAMAAPGGAGAAPAAQAAPGANMTPQNAFQAAPPVIQSPEPPAIDPNAGLLGANANPNGGMNPFAGLFGLLGGGLF